MAFPACSRTPSPVDRVAQERADQAARAAQDAHLPKPVQDFLARAASAAGKRFTVTYAGPGAGRTVLVQRPPDRRIDVIGPDGTEAFVHQAGTTFACHRPPGTAPWTCDRTGTLTDPDLSIFTPENLGVTVNALAAARDQYRFTVVTERLAGTTASCLVTTPLRGGTAARLCIAGDGAVLRIDTPQRQLTATAYRAGAAPVRPPA